jgi:outer membrane protein assembly factor BamB
LFLTSVVTPITFGYNVKTSNKEYIDTPEQLNNPSDHQWPMFKNNAQCTGYTLYNASHNKGGEKWKYYTEDTLRETATIDKDGILYVATSFGELHAVYPNGTMKWWVDINEWIEQAPAIAPDGTIYIGTEDDNLYAFNPNGTWKLIFEANDRFGSELAVDSNGTVYAGSYDGYVYALYSNGTLKWKYFADGLGANIALDKNDNIYFYAKNHLRCLNPDGTRKWIYKVRYEYGPIIGDDGTIYISSWDDYLYALYPNGTEKWNVSLRDCTGFFSLGPDGTIIFSGYDLITTVNPTDGSINWQYPIPVGYNYVRQSDAVIDSNGTIYFPYTFRDYNGYLCALKPDGTFKWETHLSSDIQPYDLCYIWSHPSISSDGTVYISTKFYREDPTYGYLHAIGKQNPIEAPDEPIIIGETNGLVGWNYDYTFQAFSPSGDDVYYYVDWGDIIHEQWLGPYPSGTKVNLTHSWEDNKTYTLMARAKTADGLCSQWNVLPVSFHYSPDAPSAPVIDGPPSGRIGVKYKYTFNSTSPLGRDVYYHIEWEDDHWDWLGPFSSGEEVTFGYIWDYEFYFLIRARAKDSENLWGPWGKFYVDIPREKAVASNMLLWRLVERFPLLQKLQLPLN